MADLVILVVLLAAGAGALLLLADLRTVPRGSCRDGAASVSVVIPARDEEATLPALLASLQRLGAPAIEVVVVDDGSRDATAAVALAAGATVLPATAPPPGWTGKAWACHLGAETTSGDLLLFLDADTVLEPDALDGLLRLHERHGGLVSVQPFHAVVRPYEQLSSYFNVMALLASGAFTRRPASRPMAFGPCLLTSRVDYERAGGHAAVRGEILDDVQLAAAYDRAGLPVLCAVGGDAIRMRSYPGGLRQLADGWTKNFASGASAAAPGPTLGGGAVDQRPPRRRRRRPPRAGRGRDRVGRVPDGRGPVGVGGRVGGGRGAAAVDPAPGRLVPLVDLGALPRVPAGLRRDLRVVGRAHGRPPLGALAGSDRGPAGVLVLRCVLGVGGAVGEAA